MNLSEKIKAYALDIGYHAVGITTADPFEDHLKEVTSRSSMYDFYSLDPRRFMEGALVQKMMPKARSIICMALDYARTDFPAELVGKIGRIYQARCYGPAPDRINGARYELMVKFLESLGAETGKGFFIPERRAAARAGAITFGKNNFAYAKGCGSFIVLHSIVVDLDLEYDAPTLRVDCPENCTKIYP
jgi:epoxyqueuosine reductase